MDKSDLEKLIGQNKSIREMSIALNCSDSTVKHWLKKFKLKTNFLRYNKGGTSSTNRAKILEFGTAFKCTTCGEENEACFMKLGPGRKSRTICKKCHNQQRIQQQRGKKEKFVLLKGGKCEKCGYSKCLSALEFHHVNPKEKDPRFIHWKNFSDIKIQKELDGCILVCSNCHREIHYGQHLKLQEKL